MLRGAQRGAGVRQSRPRMNAFDHALGRFGIEPAEFTSTTRLILRGVVIQYARICWQSRYRFGFGLNPL